MGWGGGGGEPCPEGLPQGGMAAVAGAWLGP
jgi:hypothetical protein